jgi:hypothetical protein
MFDHLCSPLERTHLAEPCDISSIPFHSELEVLVRIEALCVDRKLCHFVLSSRLNLARHLLQLDDHEFSRLEWSKADHYVDDAKIDVILCCRLLIAFDEIGISRRRTLKCSLAKQVVHESPYVETYLCPQRLVVGLKDYPLQSTVKALFNEERSPPHWQVFVLVGSDANLTLLKQLGVKTEPGKLTEVPVYDPETFETNVRGIYVAGHFTHARHIKAAIDVPRRIIPLIAKDLKSQPR